MDVNGIGCKRDSRFIRPVCLARLTEKADDSCRVVAARKHAPSAPPRTHSLRAFDDRKALTAAAIGAELLDPFEFASACLLQHTRSVYCLPRRRSPSRGLRRFQAGCALPTRSFQPLLGRPRPGSRRTARDHGVLCCNMVHRVASWCTVLQHGVPCCIMVHRVASWCTVLQHGVLCCNMVYYAAARAGGVDRWPARAAQLGEALDLLLQATAGGDRQDIPCDMCARRL